MENNTEQKIREDLKKEIVKAETRGYNKDYYAKNKKLILAKACEKVTCKLCLRTVISNNLQKHYKSVICAKTQKSNLELKNRSAMNNNKDINKLVKKKKRIVIEESESDSESDSDVSDSEKD